MNKLIDKDTVYYNLWYDEKTRAHLIAAAPEMYRFIDDLLYDNELGGLERILAKQLLAKARGE